MRQIKALFKENAELLALSDQADSLTVSQTIWNNIVPDALKPYTHAGNVKHKRLTVYANNGAVAAKIKLLLPNLLTKLQKQEVEITSIRVEVQVQSTVRLKPKTQRFVSPTSARYLSDLANKLGDSPLAEVLARLSSRM
jgi:hypothetical protein